MTVSLSKISSSGLTTAFDATVVTFGAAFATVVSDTSPQAVITASCASVAAIDSR